MIEVLEDRALLATVNLSVSQNTGTETGETQITVTATADTAVNGNQTVDLAVSGTGITVGDFSLSNTTITILDGETTGSVTFTILDDAVVEATETATLTISNPSAGLTLGMTTSQDVVITDNDTATFTIDSVTVNEGDGTLTFTVSLSNPIDTAATVNVSYGGGTATGGGTDYDSATDQVTFAANSTTSQTVTVAITNDNLVELSETFTASLSLDSSTPLTGYSTDLSDTGTGTITDNDTATFTIDSVTVNEGDGTLTFTVSLSNPIDTAATVNVSYGGGTATGGGTDYDSTTDQVTFAANSTTSQTVTVAITEDLEFEGTETFTASLALDSSTPLTGYSTDLSDTGTGTITDNDTATSATFNAPTNGIADSYRVKLNGMSLEIYDGANNLLASRTFNPGDTLTINGEDGQDDTLVVDFTSGNPIPSGGLVFNGGTGGLDSLTIVGGSATTITHTFTNASDGSVDIDGSLISYTGLEPITDNLSAVHRVFTFTGGVETISLTDTGGADGMMTIDSDLAESVTFTNPTSSLTINVNGGDTVAINSLDAAFAAAVTFNGTTSANTFKLMNAERLPDTTDLTVSGTAVFDLNGFAETIDALNGDGTIDNTAVGPVTLTVGANSGSSTFDGVLQNGSGTLSLVKTGSGTLTLTNANTYTGTTTISGGTLLVNGSIAAGPANPDVIVESGATLGGNGVVSGSVTVQPGGTVAPGASTAILNTGSVTFTAGSNFNVEVNGNVAGTSYDQLNVTGTVVLGGATLNVGGTIPSLTGQVITIINNDGVDPVVGTFAGLAEGDTVFINSIGFKLSYQGGTGNDVTLTQLIQVTVVASPGTKNEDEPGVFTFTFTRDGILDVMTVNFSVTSTATFIDDYTQAGAKTFTGTNGTVVFGFGQLTAIVTIDPKQDQLVEPNESITITLLPGSTYAPAIPNSATVTILDDDNDVTVVSSSASVAEDGGGSVEFTFTRTGTLANPLTVNFNVSGTAQFGSDYTQAGADSFSATNGTVSFAAGVGTAVVTITPTLDLNVELDETVLLSLRTGVGYQFVAPSSASTTILNDDVAPKSTISVSVAPGSVAEDGSTNLVYTFTRTLITDVLTVNFDVSGDAVFGTDYSVSGAKSFSATAGSVTFGFGQSTATVIVDPTADVAFEPNETVVLTISPSAAYNVDGANSAATGTITNDDAAPPVVSIAVSPSSVSEDGKPNLVYTFTRTGNLSIPLTVTFNVSGDATFKTDYTVSGAKSFSATTGTITFGSGKATATLTINPSADSTIEPDETVILTVVDGAGYTADPVNDSATGTILNDDSGVSVAVSPMSVTEDGAGVLEYTFTRTGSTDKAITAKFKVNGTAKFGSDYTQSGASSFSASSGQVFFGIGVSTVVVTIDPTSDTLVEGDETVKLTVTKGTGYQVLSPSVATGTILDNDSLINPQVTIAVSPAAVGETTGNQLVFTFTRDLLSGDPLTVSFTVGGTANFQADYTQTGAKTFSGTAGTITFGFGQSTAKLFLLPVNDGLAEGGETVILTLAPGAGYGVGAIDQAIGTIFDLLP